MEKKIDGVLRKIQGLLSTANISKSEEEAQTAFALAQRLMAKYNIENKDITTEKHEELYEDSIIPYKRLFWYERELAHIIADNFRVKTILYTRREKKKHPKRSLYFYGLKDDVKIAKQVYELGLIALHHHVKIYVKSYKEYEQQFTSKKIETTEIKKSYIKGFLFGIEDRLDEEKEKINEEFGLTLQTPLVVTKGLEELKLGNSKPHTSPAVNDGIAYYQGFHDGKSIDYKQSTVE